MARQVVLGEPGSAVLWVRCANAICERIADGRYPDGEWLPEVVMIAADLGTTGIPVSRALEAVHGQGIISRVDGYGYYAGSGEPPPRLPGRQPMHSLGKAGSPVRPAEQAGRALPHPAALGEERYVTVHELAAFLRVAAMTIYRLIRSGEIGGVIRISDRVYRIPLSGARAYLARCLIDPAQFDVQAAEEQDGE